MRHVSRRCGSAILLALGLAVIAAVPAAAADTYPASGPLEVRIFGANDAPRDFIVVSAQDRRAAAALVEQVASAMQGPARPIEDAAATFPHYRIGVSRLGPTYITDPWIRTSQTSFIYYPGREATSFLVIQFTRGDATLEQRWILASPEVASMLQRHLEGLTPIGLLPSSPGGATDPWGMAVGVFLLAGFGLMLFRGSAAPHQAVKERRKGDVTGPNSEFAAVSPR